MPQRTDPARVAKQFAAAQRAYQRRRRAAAVAQVRVFQRWLTTGGELKHIPEIPSDNDYRIFRQTQRHQ